MDENLDEHISDIEQEALEQTEAMREFQPREYQLQILAQARLQNCIAFLDTGTGKTFIAIMLLQETPGKAVFVAPTRALVLQQGLVAQRFNVNAGIFQGRKCEAMGRLKWQKKLEQHSAFFFTPQLFLNVLRFGYLRIEDFSLLIFDECHWCFGQHPYNNILREFVDPLPVRPKIFGMTASPVTSKVTSSIALMDKVAELANNLYCTYAPVDRASVDAVANKPQVQIERFKEVQTPLHLESEILTRLRDSDTEGELPELEEILRKNQPYVYDLLGGLGFSLYLSDLASRVSSSTLQRTLLLLAEELYRPVFKSSRIKRLMAILKQHFVGIQVKQTRAIVFTERRVTAYYLSMILRLDPEFSAYQCDVVVGLNSEKSRFDMVKMRDAQQESVIRRFREEEINVLVATSVAEEGLDIPSCDLVIRFESFSSNLRSYVQSRGRARQLNSKFYLLLEEKDDALDLQKIEDFNQAIEFLKLLADYGAPLVSPHFQPMESYAVADTGARVSMNWSCQYLADICASLPADPFTEKKEPQYATEYFPKNACQIQVLNPSHGGYLGIIRLPRELKELEEFADRLQPSAAEAKAAAALKAIARLHSLKFLTDTLRPSWLTKREIDPPKLSEVGFQVEELGVTSLPRLKLGKQSVAALPQDQTIYQTTCQPGQMLGLYVLRIQPYTYEFAGKGLAIISPPGLIEGEFRFYPANLVKNYRYSSCEQHSPPDRYDPGFCSTCAKSCHWVIPELVLQKSFQEAELSLFKTFHYYVFSSIMQQVPELVQAVGSGDLYLGSCMEQGGGDLAVPLAVVPWDFSTQEVDWGTLYNVAMCLQSWLRGEPWKPLAKEVCSGGYEQHLVQSNVTTTLFSVLGRGDHGIDTLIPSRVNYSISVKDYYFTKYAIHLQPQEVLQVKPLGKFKNAFWPLRSESHKSKDPILLPADMVSLYPIPPSIVSLARIMPTIYSNFQRRFVCGKLERDLGISRQMLQHALTCTAANEAFDYQRLETLGDTVLKFRVTKFFFFTLPEAHEGIISQERENCTCNKALYAVAMRYKLYLYMQVTSVTLKTWLPPGLHFKPKAEDDEGSDDEESPKVSDLEDLIDLKREESVLELDFSDSKADISNKQLADVVEALIGAAYLDGGLPAAERLIRGLEILPDGKRKVTALNQSRDFGSLEKRLGIRFKTPGWYCEAFLHGSAGGPRDYQRLEILGDALIDLIAMEYLYHKYPFASPGLLSKLKSAAVNNRVQAFLSVKLGLLGFLSYQNQELAGVLRQFEAAVMGLLQRGSLDIHTLPEQGLKVSADLLESLFGAILLDYDYETARNVFFSVAGDLFEAMASPETVRTNPHTQFFEWAQKNKLTGVKVKRRLEHTASGLDQYTVEVHFQGRLMAQATARSKLEASERACNEAMRKVESEWRRLRLREIA